MLDTVQSAAPLRPVPEPWRACLEEDNGGSQVIEEQIVTHRRGKWSNPGAPDATCEMCDSQVVRYLYHMEHPNSVGILGVGCVCAGHMKGGAAAARDRETSMRSRASKRPRWLVRNWRTSAKVTPTLKVDGSRVTVYPRGKGNAATIAAADDGGLYHAGGITRL